MKSLYSFVLDFKGNTYISQCWGINVEDALARWIENFDLLKVNDSILSKNVIFDEYKKKVSNIEPIDDVINVWCETFVIHDELFLLHIIKTVEDKVTGDVGTPLTY